MKKKNKAYKRLKGQQRPTEQRTKEQQPYAAANAMWCALMKAVVTDGRH
ncbi:hypothetical protein AB0H18_10640 [Streptomyces sp. NPDC020766]